jgi:hypothetical protein
VFAKKGREEGPGAVAAIDATCGRSGGPEPGKYLIFCVFRHFVIEMG